MASKGNSTLNTLFSDETFTLKNGDKIPLEGHTPQFFQDLTHIIQMWQDHITVPDAHGHSTAPSDLLGEEEMEYVLSHMEHDLEHLTRVEIMGTSVPKEDIKKGEPIHFNKPLKAFSRHIEQTKDYASFMFDSDDELVVFRTNNRVGHFNITRWTDYAVNEGESWVNTESFKVKDIHKEKWFRTHWSENKEYTVTIVDIE